MGKIMNLAIFIALSFFSSDLYGQTIAPPPDAPQQRENQGQSQAERQEQQREIQRHSEQIRQMDELRRMSDNPNVRVKPVSEIRNATPLPNTKPNREQKILLAPDSLDLNTYAAFLKQPNTGLIKIFPDVGCEENAGIVRVDAECLRWIPNSGFYSFRRKKYVSESLADIRYKDGFFISDGLLAQGIITALGNVPIENVSLANNELRFLTEYKPEPQNRDAAVQSRKITSGVKAGDYIYKNTWRAVENTTYAVRVIAYRGAFYFPFQGRLFNLLDGDARKDIIVIFRVVRKNTDGSLTLLWKELDRKESPKLIYPKKNKDNKSSNYQRGK